MIQTWVAPLQNWSHNACYLVYTWVCWLTLAQQTYWQNLQSSLGQVQRAAERLVHHVRHTNNEWRSKMANPPKKVVSGSQEFSNQLATSCQPPKTKTVQTEQLTTSSSKKWSCDMNGSSSQSSEFIAQVRTAPRKQHPLGILAVSCK